MQFCGMRQLSWGTKGKIKQRLEATPLRHFYWVNILASYSAQSHDTLFSMRRPLILCFYRAHVYGTVYIAHSYAGNVLSGDRTETTTRNSKVRQFKVIEIQARQTTAKELWMLIFDKQILKIWDGFDLFVAGHLKYVSILHRWLPLVRYAFTNKLK